MTTTKQEYPSEAGNPFGCPSTFYLDMTLKLETTEGSSLYLR